MSMLSTGVSVLAASATDAMNEPWAAHDTQVLLVALFGIAVVVVLIVWAKMHAFLALTIAALVVGVGSGIPLGDLTKSYETGVGGVLGHVGVLIALGAMLGKLLGDSGGADKIVDTLLRGSKASLPWKMALIAAIIGIPMFFEVGLVLLVPVVMLAVQRTKLPAMQLAIPALAGLSVLHGFVPPHPGPVAAVGILNADLGVTLALGLVVAIPTVIICGPLFARLAARWVPIGPAGAGLAFLTEGSAKTGASVTGADAKRTPSFGWTLATVLSPVFLMLLHSAANMWINADTMAFKVLNIIGDPVIALLLAVLLAMITFGTAVGFTASALSKKIGDSLLPVVGVMLIVGAGGGFKQVLVDGGTSVAIGKIAVALSLSALIMGWIIAVLIRVATGSATVATVTAAGIVAPLAAGLPPAQLALVVLSVGAGSVFFSHVNDAGFWLVKEYFGMTVWETIKTWSVMETLISVVGLGLVLLLSIFV